MATTNAPSKRNCDFICSLPNSILHRILGFLKTKEAVQTCVLSKRWEHLWMSIASLNFKLDNGRAGWFVKFVNAVVIRCKPLDLDVFRLSCHKLCSRYEDHERDWIRYAVNHNTQVLDLSLYSSVPRYIYTCTSLEELHLNYRYKLSSVKIVNLPNLRKLSISNAFHSILRNSPTNRTELFINASNLLSFLYDGELSLPYKTTLNMPSLASSCLISRDSSMIKCFEGIATCLRFLASVELLELHFESCQCKELSTVVLPLELPIFQKLENVTVTFRMFSCFQMVTWILKSSPNVTKLTILQQEKCLIHEKEEDSANVPTVTSSTIAISSCKKLEIVEVKYWKYNKMVQQLIDTLRDGTKEFENLKINTSKYKTSMQYLKKKEQLSF